MNSRIQSVSVFAPATVANVGSAFDVLGLALEAPGDTVTIRRTAEPVIRIAAISGDGGRLPRETEKNTASVSVEALINHCRSIAQDSYAFVGMDIYVEKGLPAGSGLGSSSASAVAAVVAANELLGSPLARHELLPFAMKGEQIACGTAHADNVAPCLLGGCILIRSYSPLDIITLPSPQNIWLAILCPALELSTFDSRRVLKRTVTLESAVSQWGNVAALVAAIYRDDIDLMGRALEDTIIEPERAPLIPGYQAAKGAALAAGAAGCSISGSGPSLFALCHSEEQAHHVNEAMQRAFSAAGISVTQHVSRVNRSGARIVARG